MATQSRVCPTTSAELCTGHSEVCKWLTPDSVPDASQGECTWLLCHLQKPVGTGTGAQQTNARPKRETGGFLRAYPNAASAWFAPLQCGSHLQAAESEEPEAQMQNGINYSLPLQPACLGLWHKH